MANNKDRQSQEKVLSSGAKQHLGDMMAQKNVLSDETFHYIQGYLIYLRKSRQDDPNETVEEVLAKHENILQELAMRELGGRIPEENIYREIVSGGESIEERIEIKKLLSRMEYDKEIKGVLVVDPQRLSRGSLTDCDRLIMSFQYTSTRIVTPMMTYDLQKKMERRFFQDELMRGRDYLDYVKETLVRGRVAAAKRGCYSSAHAPFGYDRVKKGKDWTLEPNDDADAVRLMFDLYVTEGLSIGDLARRLEAAGVRKKSGKPWHRSELPWVMRNPVYIGKIRYGYNKQVKELENGEQVTRRHIQPEDNYILAEGKHPGIVDPEIFAAAESRLRLNSCVSAGFDLTNVLAGLLRCKNCGRVMCRIGKSKNSKPMAPRLQCPTKGCCKSATYDSVVTAVISTLEHVELPNLQTKLANGEGNAVVIQRRRVDSLVKQMDEYRRMEDFQYDQLESGKYSQEVFDRRNAALREKMEACERDLYQARQAMPRNVNYEERIESLQRAIAAMKDPDMDIEAQNRLLRAIVDHIDYSAEGKSRFVDKVYLDVHLRL